MTLEQIAEQLTRIHAGCIVWCPLCEQTKQAILSALQSVQAEGELERLRQALAEAAMEINCAGPVAHRIRVLKAEHEAKLATVRADTLREAAGVAERRGADEVAAILNAEADKFRAHPPEPQRQEGE